ncbi:MAG: 23S rRNA methyltransferase [Betaproteobacteria bacterium]|nr:23S rRNA methyltransferase [Betaproteobacteria bacterium]
MAGVRPKNSRDWVKRHLSDPFVKKSKEEGFRSRAVYKLSEIDATERLLRPGMTVIDLGSTPGAWSQWVVKKVGARGKVVAIDLLDMQPIQGVQFIQGDFSREEGLQAVIDAIGGSQSKVDLVLSDMAPNLTGIALTDQARMFNLAELALEFCREFLKPDGDFVIKVFQGSGYIEFVRAMRELFKKVSVEKPGASRAESGELYLVGKGRK